MKRKIGFMMVLVTGLLLAPGTSRLMAQTAQKDKEMQQKTKYYCPHHPDQVSDKPGKCAKCGMDLVVMKDDGSKKEQHGMMDEKMKKDQMMKSDSKEGMKKEGSSHEMHDMKMKKDSMETHPKKMDDMK